MHAFDACVDLSCVDLHASLLPQISLVTDINYANGQNPCTEYLRKKYPRMKLVSGDVGHDFSYLVHATHLVIGGVSTFSQLAAFLSPSLRHVYLFSWSEVRGCMS